MTGESKKPDSKSADWREAPPSPPPLAETLGPVSPHADTQPRAKSLDEAMPEVFGRYRILQRIGQGGMGAVYLAHDTQLDRPVALKVPTFKDDVDGQLVERFYREARAAATLDHPNLCPVYDVGQIENRHYLTMAYIEGRTLADYLRGDKLFPTRQVAAVIRKIASALQAAHERGIIHRDLKPSNIMVNQRREPVIMDFGLAQRLNATDTRLTQTGTIVGTPAYMSPEQISAGARPVGPASDIYSLGVMMYEMLTGRLPFQGPPFVVLGQILSVEPEPPTAIRADLEPKLAAICLRAMAKQPDQRFESMAALSEALRAFLQQAQEPSLPIPVVVPPQSVAAPPAGESTLAHQFFQSLEGTKSKTSKAALRHRERQQKLLMLWGAVGGLCVALLIGILVLFSFSSNDGTIRIEVLNAVGDVEARIDGRVVPLASLYESLTLSPSKHQLMITGTKVETLDRTFAVQSGANETLVVRLAPKLDLAWNSPLPDADDVTVAPSTAVTPATSQVPGSVAMEASNPEAAPPPDSSVATNLPTTDPAPTPTSDPVSPSPPTPSGTGASGVARSTTAVKPLTRSVMPDLPVDANAPVTIDGKAEDWKGVASVDDARNEAEDDRSRNIARTAAVHNVDSLYVMIATVAKPSTDDRAFWLNIDYTGDGRSDVQVGLNDRGDHTLWLLPVGGEATAMVTQGVAYSIDEVVEVRIPWQTIRDKLTPAMAEMLPSDAIPLDVRVTAEGFVLATDKRVDYGEPTYSEARLDDAQRTKSRALAAKFEGPLKFETIWLRDGNGWDARYGLDEKSLASTSRTLAGRGLALASVNAYVDDLGSLQFAGLWTKTGGISTTARVGLDRASLEKTIADNGSKGLRPVSVDVYNLDGEPRFAAVWANDGNNYSWLWKISDATSLQNDFNALTQQGYGVVAQSGRVVRGELTYVTLWVQMTGSRPASFNLPEPDFRQKVSNYGPGMRPILIDAYREGSNLTFPVMWAHDGQTVTDWHVRSSIGNGQFDNEVTTHRRQGYRLLNLCIVR